jgi:hypothetical protein
MNFISTRNSTPRSRHQRRGESFGGCLLMIALVLGGTMFAWNKWGRYRPLIKAGDGITVLKGDEPGAAVEYNRSFREKNYLLSHGVRDTVNRFYIDTNKGKYKDKAEFEQKVHEVYQLLLDGIDNQEMHSVPKEHLEAHKSLSLSYRHFYECVSAIEQAYYLEGDEKKKLMTLAQQELTTGWKLSMKGTTSLESKIPVRPGS